MPDVPSGSSTGSPDQQSSADGKASPGVTGPAAPDLPSRARRASVDEIIDAAEGPERDAAADRSPLIATAILDFIGQVPATEERRHHSPQARARRLGNGAAARAAMAAGTLSLPPGVLGWLTILPELRTVWQQQAQMVADIAGVYGRHHELSREVMLYCLFRHIAPAAFRSLVRREGAVHVVGRASAPVFAAIAAKIAARVSLRVVGRGASRWLPVVGAVGNGGFAWLDTGRVANTAIELFSHPLVVAQGAQRPNRRP